ncbi:MAG: hypothetical protein ACRES9_06160 [Gammaproteobacteria bacterium]
MISRKFSGWLGIFALAALIGCSGSDPLDQKVDAGSAHDFAMWRQRESDRLTNQQGDALNNAIDALKLKAQAQGATGDAIDENLRKDIDGKTVREVMQLGYSWKLATLDEQRSYVDSFLKQNADLTTKPGDTASADYLATRRDEQTARRRALDLQISELTEEIKALGLKPEPAKLPPKPADDAAANAATPTSSKQP